jgi:hypothetical protein
MSDGSELKYSTLDLVMEAEAPTAGMNNPANKTPDTRLIATKAMSSVTALDVPGVLRMGDRLVRINA